MINLNSKQNYNGLINSNQAPTIPAPHKHGGCPQQGHTPGNDCAALAMAAWLPLPPQRPSAPRASRFGAEEIPHVHLCQRLFLARPRRMQIF